MPKRLAGNLRRILLFCDVQKILTLLLLLTISPFSFGSAQLTDEEICTQLLWADPFADDFGRLMASSKNIGLQVEIGGAHKPICPGCLQIDSALSVRSKLGVQPTAASERGIIAQAHALPLMDDSVEFIVSKNFPWFGPSRRPDVILPLLQEYHRVLVSGGSVLVVRHGVGLENEFRLHERLAASLGFKIKYPNLAPRFASGLLLLKH